MHNEEQKPGRKNRTFLAYLEKGNFEQQRRIWFSEEIHAENSLFSIFPNWNTVTSGFFKCTLFHAATNKTSFLRKFARIFSWKAKFKKKRSKKHCTLLKLYISYLPFISRVFYIIVIFLDRKQTISDWNVYRILKDNSYISLLLFERWTISFITPYTYPIINDPTLMFNREYCLKMIEYRDSYTIAYFRNKLKSLSKYITLSTLEKKKHNPTKSSH